MSKPKHIPLGFEVGTGRAVEIPLGHLVCFGVTQMAGKTTAMEALIVRAGVKGLAFITKRGEGGFSGAHRIEPYYSESSDGRPYWQFVESIVSTVMQESKKFERAWIVKAARGAGTLAAVQANIPALIKQARRDMDRDIFMLLDEYLSIVIPQIASLPTAVGITLSDGLNVMDLTDYSEEMQMLLVRSAVEWVHRHEHGVVTVIPEAWKFCPDARMTPVKPAVERLIREGAGLGNFVWSDSQDAAGLWKLVQRPAKTWLIGVQREHNELTRNLRNIPGTVAKPKAADVALLGLGTFYACFGSEAVKTYAQPAWMSAQDARAIAMGEKLIDDVVSIAAPDPISRRSAIVQPKPAPKNVQKPEKSNLEDDMSKEDVDRIEKSIKELAGIVKTAVASPRASHVPAGSAAPDTGDEDAMYERFKARLLSEGAALIKLAVACPEIEVEYERKVVALTPGRLDGKIGAMILRGFFDSAKPTEDIHKELKRHGIAYDNRTFGRALSDLTAAGALTLEDGGYKRDPETKITGVEK